MTTNLEGYPRSVKGLLKTMTQVLLLTSYLQKPYLGLSYLWQARVHRSPLPSSLCAEGRSNPCAVSTEYCKVMYVQTLPEEFFMCANLQPDEKHGARGLAAWGSCSARDARAVVTALGIHSSIISLTHKQVFIPYPKEMEGSCLKLVKGTGKM